MGHREEGEGQAEVERQARGQANWEGKVRNWQTDNMVSAGAEDMVQDQADEEEELSSEELSSEEEGEYHQWQAPRVSTQLLPTHP